MLRSVICIGLSHHEELQSINLNVAPISKICAAPMLILLRGCCSSTVPIREPPLVLLIELTSSYMRQPQGIQLNFKVDLKLIIFTSVTLFTQKKFILTAFSIRNMKFASALPYSCVDGFKGDKSRASRDTRPYICRY
jgi:hypothetical protein